MVPGIVAIAKWAWRRVVMPPVIEFGAPVRREVDEMRAVWHVPVGIRPWLWFGGETLDDAEVYLDRWSESGRIDSVVMKWGDLSGSTSEKTLCLRSSRVEFVPVLSTLPDGKGPLITDRRYLEKQTHCDWTAKDQEFRYRLRVVATGYERQSEEFYFVRPFEKHPTGGRDGYFLDSEFGGVKNSRRKFGLGDWLRVVVIASLVVVAEFYSYNWLTQKASRLFPSPPSPPQITLVIACGVSSYPNPPLGGIADVVQLESSAVFQGQGRQFHVAALSPETQKTPTYSCAITNYGTQTIFDVAMSLEARFYLPQKNGAGKLFYVGHPDIFVQKIDAGIDHPYVFYIWNDSGKEADVTAPKVASFAVIGNAQRWQTPIRQPPWPTPIFLEPRPGRID